MTTCFAFKTIIKPFRTSIGARTQSTSSFSSLVDVKLNEKHGYAVLSMKKAPVNSLNLEMMEFLSESLKQLEKEKCKGIILTSALPGVFCAGLDINEMYQSQEERFRKFWFSLQTLWLQLYGSKMASIALINGHSPAGGCLLAMCCDFRIIVNGKFRIGLNETKLGIAAPPWLIRMYVNTVGVRTSERALQLGTLFSVEEALKVGLVDKVVTDIEAGNVAAEAEMEEFLKIPAMARYLSKMRIRENELKRLEENREADADLFVNLAMSAPVQTIIGKYLESLAKKK